MLKLKYEIYCSVDSLYFTANKLHMYREVKFFDWNCGSFLCSTFQHCFFFSNIHRHFFKKNGLKPYRVLICKKKGGWVLE